MANVFIGKPKEELESLRISIQKALDGVNEAVSLSNTIPGKKWIKRLASDLDAVRHKYLAIKGSGEERLRCLAQLQGREDQLGEELGLLEAAETHQRRLTSDLEALAVAMTVANQKVASR